MLKQLYQRILPAAARRLLHPVLHPRIAYVEWHARRFANGVVQFGPFTGMRLVNRSSPPLTLLLGTYEQELHPAYARLRNRRFSRVLDVGASVGYYAVGVALWRTDVEVVCWESEEVYHPQIRALACANGVEQRVEVRGFCDTAELKPFMRDMHSTLIIMDIEGYEAVLLDPVPLPALREATILVEYHDNLMPNSGAVIEARFRETHVATKYEPHHRTADDYPLDTMRRNKFLRSAAALAILERPTWLEGRHGWLLLEPKSHAAMV